MPRHGWFKPMEEMFYDALLFHGMHREGWYIQPIPADIDSSLKALKRGKKEQDWLFRSHTGKGQFYCSICKHAWKSSHTTVVWRGQWETGVIQIRIEKQGCQRCENKCQGRFCNEQDIGETIYWILAWMAYAFYNPGSEAVHKDNGASEGRGNSDESEDDEDYEGPPHDCERCEAGRKDTCKKCIKIQRRQQRRRRELK